MIKGITLLPLTVGLRDDMDDYYANHDTVPSRAWILSRVLVDEDGDRPYSEADARDLPLSDVQEYWDAFQASITAPESSAPASASVVASP